jgi:hypothetical protein
MSLSVPQRIGTGRRACRTSTSMQAKWLIYKSNDSASFTIHDSFVVKIPGPVDYTVNKVISAGLSKVLVFRLTFRVPAISVRRARDYRNAARNQCELLAFPIGDGCRAATLWTRFGRHRIANLR